MRLLITTDTVGGVWTYTKELTEGLLVRGNEVILISMGRAPSPDQRAWTRRMCVKWPGCFRYLPTEHALEWMQQNEGCYRQAEAVLMEQVESFAPDLLHLNQYCYGSLPTDLPKVVMAHSDVMSWSECCRGGQPGDSPWLRQYLRVVREGLANADALVAPSRWMMEALARNYALPAHCAVIANGRAVAGRNEKTARKLQAVTVGRVWDEGKNVRVLEEAESPMPVLVAGELALEAEPPFASSRLRLLGQLSEEAALTLFAQSAIYIATSLYEPFGLAPVEAALSGCAIVAHDIPSFREVWGESALYFSHAEELSAILHALYADRVLLQRVAARVRARARSLYSQDAMVEKYLDLYASLGARVDLVEAEHAS
ncbi:MAG TPA: glycosyltransferase family 4 protein [Acidobacteriaceae bacterium]